MFHHHASSRLLLTLIAGLAGFFLMPAASHAQDPVETLREALRIQFTSTIKPELNLVIKRRELIEKSIAAMKQSREIGTLRRAYFLKEWSQHILVGIEIKGAPIAPFRVEIGNLLVDAIREAAKDPHPDRRLALAILIGEVADADQSVDTDVKRPFEVREKFVRRLTGVTLDMARDKSAPKDASLAVRQAAIHALGKITPDPEDAFPILRDTLQNDELGPRRLAAYALTDLCRNARSLARGKRLDTIRLAITTAEIGFADADEPVRGYCLQGFAEAGRAFVDFAASPLEILIVEDKDKKAKDELAKDLKAVLDAWAKANSHVTDALSAKETNIQLAALQTLDQLGQARVKLLQNLAPERRKDRAGIFKHLGVTDPFEHIIGAKADWKRVAALLQAQDVRLRRGAMEFFELLGEQGEPAIAEISDALSDPDRIVRWTAARTIRQIAPKLVSPKTIDALNKLLIDPDPDLSAAAAAAIETLGPAAQGSIDFLAFIIGNGDAANRNWDSENRIAAMKALIAINGPAAQQALPKLLDALTDPDVRIRREAAYTIGKLGRPTDAKVADQVLTALKTALRDDDAEVRLNASEAILMVAPRK